MRQAWPIAFLFAFLALLFCFVFFVAIPRPGPSGAGTSATAATGGGGQAPESSGSELSTADQAERFAKAIDQRQPKYTSTPWECPVDGTELQVPDLDTTNNFGGVATDLMAIALGPPPEEFARPSLDKQNWEMLLATCPTCRATFHGIDLWQLKNGDYALEHWDLGELVPQLAKRDIDKWTVEERVLVRLLTQRAAGVEDVELGFSAMQGAYAANFDTWYGRDVHIPSAAFYALAAGYFHRALESGEGLNDMARSVASQTMGESYRLLGRADDAAAAFKAARKYKDLDPYQQEVLNQLEALLANQDFSLHVANVAEKKPPPGGWYLSEMLPTINSDLDYYRVDWNHLDDPEQIIAAIVELIP